VDLHQLLFALADDHLVCNMAFSCSKGHSCIRRCWGSLKVLLGAHCVAVASAQDFVILRLVIQQHRSAFFAHHRTHHCHCHQSKRGTVLSQWGCGHVDLRCGRRRALAAGARPDPGIAPKPLTLICDTCLALLKRPRHSLPVVTLMMPLVFNVQLPSRPLAITQRVPHICGMINCYCAGTRTNLCRGVAGEQSETDKPYIPGRTSADF
jgi:hypothetical protein